MTPPPAPPSASSNEFASPGSPSVGAEGARRRAPSLALGVTLADSSVPAGVTTVGTMPVVSLPDHAFSEAVGDVDGVDVVIGDLRGVPPRPDEIEFLVPPYMFRWDHGILTELPSLKVVQLLTAGFDTVRRDVPDGVILANAAGVHDTSTAELAMTLALASLRRIPEFVRNQASGTWGRMGLLPSLADKRVLILGYGGIGRALARRLLAFETSVTAVASRARDGDEFVSHVHSVDEIAELLPDADVVMVAVPYSQATHHLVDDAFLARMPDGSVLVNVARGRVADTDALMRHAGRLRIAVDVTDPEPLPPEHPMWRLPDVLISPHAGGPTSAFTPRAVSLVRSQLEAFVAGEPLTNVVNR